MDPIRVSRHQEPESDIVAPTDQACMCLIPGGTFRMGSDVHYLEECPAHLVSVDPLRMDPCAVTDAQFAQFVAATAIGRSRKGRWIRRPIPVRYRACSSLVPSCFKWPTARSTRATTETGGAMS